jgi:hypothetical protein
MGILARKRFATSPTRRICTWTKLETVWMQNNQEYYSPFIKPQERGFSFQSNTPLQHPSSSGGGFLPEEFESFTPLMSPMSTPNLNGLHLFTPLQQPTDFSLNYTKDSQRSNSMEEFSIISPPQSYQFQPDSVTNQVTPLALHPMTPAMLMQYNNNTNNNEHVSNVQEEERNRKESRKNSGNVLLPEGVTNPEQAQMLASKSNYAQLSEGLSYVNYIDLYFFIEGLIL